MKEKIQSALIGLAVGDALGVPVEFSSRDVLKKNPVKNMRAFGCWNQPAGTWSDDSSLAFCLAESLTNGYDINDIAGHFVRWRFKGWWGAHHKVFDIGGATRAAIDRLHAGITPQLSGGIFEDDNGNGSLMRILPLIVALQHEPVEEVYKKVKAVSSITHAHFRSVMACFIYMQVALAIYKGANASDAYEQMQQQVNAFAGQHDFNPAEMKLFSRVLQGNIKNEKEQNIHSGGYVLHTLEASLWCIFNTDNYHDAVLKAVNLGGDTDTTGCVTGGLAGLLYGYEDIPSSWLDVLARKDDIKDLSERLFLKWNP